MSSTSFLIFFALAVIAGVPVLVFGSMRFEQWRQNRERETRARRNDRGRRQLYSER